MDKKLHKKASKEFKNNKKSKMTLGTFKAAMILKKPKYNILMPKYRAELRELRAIKKMEDEAYSSDLDVELSLDAEADVNKMK